MWRTLHAGAVSSSGAHRKRRLFETFGCEHLRRIDGRCQDADEIADHDRLNVVALDSADQRSLGPGTLVIGMAPEAEQGDEA